ncbi:MAG: hypothetical protein AAB522_01410 [Patescibacteria group bacterium]
MLKKRFFLFIIGFSFFVVFLNFSLVSASLEGASKTRLLSLSMILSVFEILIAVFIYLSLFRSASNFSKRERQLFLILDNLEYGTLAYNNLNEVLFLNSKAEEILGVKYGEIAGVRLTVDLSLRNPKLNKLLGAIFYSKIEPEGQGGFFVSKKEVQKSGESIFLISLKKNQ